MEVANGKGDHRMSHISQPSSGTKMLTMSLRGCELTQCSVPCQRILIYVNTDYHKLHLRNRKHVPCFYRVIETSGSLGEREMLWEHEPQASVSTSFSSSPKLSRVFL